MRVTAYIGLGANLGDPVRQIEEAIARLELVPKTRVAGRAPLYRSKPVGPPGQPDYANTVVALETALEPEALLRETQAIEAALGRDRTGAVRWGPRVIDLDLLLYGDRTVKTPLLIIPHPEMTRRRFVLAPLADLAPSLVVEGKTVRALLDALDDDPGSVWR